VIGGNGNSVAILRRRSPGILGDKQYFSVGLYQTRISVLFLEIRLYISVIVAQGGVVFIFCIVCILCCEFLWIVHLLLPL
jgi:hypothetical protein